MCKFPKVIYISQYKGGPKLPQIQACGKCYDCRMNKRAESVLRCRKEFTDSVCSFFVTLTYSDANLVYWDCNRVERVSALCAAKANPRAFDAYGKFVFDKRHSSQFMRDMQKCIKKYNEHLLFRFVLNGEYGTWTHRPHFHALIFSPLSFSLNDFKVILSQCWRYGNITVTEVTDSRINYVAKHTMKEDAGNELQQKVSPIFRIMSRYRGGIGIGLKDDETLLANYYQDSNYTFNGRYKVVMPRYIKKILHPQKYSEEELFQLSRDSYSNLCSRILIDYGYDFDSVFYEVMQNDFSTELALYQHTDRVLYENMKLLDLKMRAAVKFYRERNKDVVISELRDYYQRKFNNHKQKLKDSNYFNDF